MTTTDVAQGPVDVEVSLMAAMERLLPCPFCGGTNTSIEFNGQVWTGMKYSEPISVSVIYHCEPLPGPSRRIERIGCNLEQSIERWNMRANSK